MAAVTLESTNHNSAAQLKIDNQLAKKYPFDWQVRVYYEDTDSGGVVYHSNYLKYMERARTEWLRHLGFEQADLNDKLNNDSLNNDTLNALFVVHSMQIQFKKPAKLNDLLTISSELTTIGFGSIVFLQKIVLNTQHQDAQNQDLENQVKQIPEKQILVEASVKIACVNALTFKPSEIPQQLKLTLQQLQRGDDQTR